MRVFSGYLMTVISSYKGWNVAEGALRRQGGQDVAGKVDDTHSSQLGSSVAGAREVLHLHGRDTVVRDFKQLES